MPLYRIHRMRDIPRESFRWAAHTGGIAVVKLKDYVSSEEVQGANPYECWKTTKEQGRALRPGDLLESLEADASGGEVIGDLRIAKYIGFEPARWFVPEPKSVTPSFTENPDATNNPEEALYT